MLAIATALVFLFAALMGCAGWRVAPSVGASHYEDTNSYAIHGGLTLLPPREEVSPDALLRSFRRAAAEEKAAADAAAHRAAARAADTAAEEADAAAFAAWISGVDARTAKLEEGLTAALAALAGSDPRTGKGVAKTTEEGGVPGMVEKILTVGGLPVAMILAFGVYEWMRRKNGNKSPPKLEK